MWTVCCLAKLAPRAVHILACNFNLIFNLKTMRRSVDHGCDHTDCLPVKLGRLAEQTPKLDHVYQSLRGRGSQVYFVPGKGHLTKLGRQSKNVSSAKAAKRLGHSLLEDFEIGRFCSLGM